VISYEEYYPYGTTSYQAGRSVAEVSLKRYRYTGKERDEETGLYYHGARYYAPWLGRWTATDRIGIEDGLNLYLYVSGNPILRIDPDGHRDGIAEMILDEQQRQQQQKTQQKTVVLDSGKEDDFTKWATQFKQKDPTKRDVVAYESKKTIVENYQKAAAKAGKDGILVVSVGHGVDAVTAHCGTKSCPANDLSIGMVQLTPDKKFEVDTNLFDYMNRPEQQKKYEEGLLKRSKDPKQAKLLTSRERAEIQTVEAKEKKLQTFLEVGKKLREEGIKEVDFLSCRIGNSTVFLQQIADLWGIDIAAYQERTGASQEKGRAFVSLFDLQRKEIPGNRSETEMPSRERVVIHRNPQKRPVDPSPIPTK
jgi:RHS repeat-associated protein